VELTCTSLNELVIVRGKRRYTIANEERFVLYRGDEIQLDSRQAMAEQRAPKYVYRIE
jgi:hypothetical protein